ncbi:MAG: orotidine-5'-phosphate decarboxylase, partial [Ignavibacteriaceae bacterium]|nr:orotidine-5'-phosphate decarboxylase [Ignavibacteriaceae bacterium]
MSALQKLENKNNEGRFICVGLDTDINKIPDHIKMDVNPVVSFNKAIVEATKDNAAAYKINFAFYEKDGSAGINNLEKTLSSIPDDVLVIADVKRGDIGNTSKMYAKSIFESLSFDASTLNPLMGKDSLDPFLHYSDKLHFILALTSNPGANDFEKLQLSDGSFLYQKIISKVQEWNKEKNCGIVFGATNSVELSENIELFEDLPVLLPGIGAQGGRLQDVIELFKSLERKNYLINVSRGIIYKSNGDDFDAQAGSELENLNNQINE